jgi:selenoprotein W-related protein
MQRTPQIEIEYCTQCRWLLRAAWMAQELLTTFSTEIGELELVPGTGGVFEIRIGDNTVWSRAEKGRFPEIKELKQAVRDRMPRQGLGPFRSMMRWEQICGIDLPFAPRSLRRWARCLG